MIVCHCHGVSDRAIRRAVREGAADPAEVGQRCGAGTTCGGCLDTVRELVHREANREHSDRRAIASLSPAA
jgi:bacterioferritin-associated ferredoxin